MGFVALACSAETAEVPADPASRTPAPAERFALPARGARAKIPGGDFSSGSEPGKFERRPELEPRTTRTALGPFEIDAEPYPGGPSGALLGVGRERAAELCAAQSGRLCTELEWERACKGPMSHPFPNGMDLDPTCTKSPGCPSGFGVWGMGSLREWTASEWRGNAGRSSIVRGASGSAPGAQRRCAHRDTVTSALRADHGSVADIADIGFRCCYGAPNAARVVMPGLGKAFEGAELPTTELGRLLAAATATRAIARGVHYFDEAAAKAVVLGRGGRDLRATRFTSAPLRWNPAPGVDLLVVTGRHGPSTSFVVVFDAFGDGSRRLASSFVMENETGPVALAYDTSIRELLHFSTCWECPGETGRILYRDPDRALILQP